MASEDRLLVTVYTTKSTAVRKTADDCRRLLQLLDALRVVYEVVVVDSKGVMQIVQELLNNPQPAAALPQVFVGDASLGGYDALHDLNERNEVAPHLRSLGYTEFVEGGDDIPVRPRIVQIRSVRKVVKKVKKPKTKAPGDAAAAEGAEEDEDAPPPPPSDSSDAEDGDEPPPPPPESDEDEDGIVLEDDDADPPPPPPPEDDEDE
jgi:glutaredoxin